MTECAGQEPNRMSSVVVGKIEDKIKGVTERAKQSSGKNRDFATQNNPTELNEMGILPSCPGGEVEGEVARPKKSLGVEKEKKAARVMNGLGVPGVAAVCTYTLGKKTQYTTTRQTDSDKYL